MSIVNEFLEETQNKWVYAKSYAKFLPHHYVTRKIVANDKLLEAFIAEIRLNGIVKQFYKRQFIYLEVGEYCYWEMGRPIPSVEVLNRAKIDSKVNLLPVIDEQARQLKHKLEKRELILHELLMLQSPTPEDQKKINFLMNTTRRVDGGGKNIIDNYKLPIYLDEDTTA